VVSLRFAGPPVARRYDLGAVGDLDVSVAERLPTAGAASLSPASSCGALTACEPSHVTCPSDTRATSSCSCVRLRMVGGSSRHPCPAGLGCVATPGLRTLRDGCRDPGVLPRVPELRELPRLFVCRSLISRDVGGGGNGSSGGEAACVTTAMAGGARNALLRGSEPLATSSFAILTAAVFRSSSAL
jgi:hypothetical protein